MGFILQSTKKGTQLWDWASGKKTLKHFTPKHLLKTLYFSSLFNSNLIYGCPADRRYAWGQDQNEEFKKIEKLQQKVIRIISFLPLNATVEKQMYGMNILKLKRTSCCKISYL